MAYRVELADAALADVEAIYAWVLQEAPVRGPAWFDELTDSLFTLEEFPNRCPLAREAKEARRKIRCLLFGKGRGVYRILYEVDEKSRTVWIHHVRHGARRDLSPEEMR
jgi:plasmid stabilization system protein ParE